MQGGWGVADTQLASGVELRPVHSGHLETNVLQHPPLVAGQLGPLSLLGLGTLPAPQEPPSSRPPLWTPEPSLQCLPKVGVVGQSGAVLEVINMWWLCRV